MRSGEKGRGAKTDGGYMCTVGHAARVCSRDVHHTSARVDVAMEKK